MTVVLCGIGADSGNVRPVPALRADRRFEYVPIPEKGPTTTSDTFGNLERRLIEGALADGIEAIRPRSRGEWITDPDAIATQPVHRDPNLSALTYGEHRPGYVRRLRALEPGDAVGFYTGLRTGEDATLHRYLVGAFTVADSPTVLSPEDPPDRIESTLARHPANAHRHRLAANGRLYYHDPAFTDRPGDVVIVDGTRPGGLCDRAVRLSGRREGSHYYLRRDRETALAPADGRSNGVYLGGFKPAIECSIDGDRFFEWIATADGGLAMA